MASSKPTSDTYADDSLALVQEILAMRGRIPKFAIPAKGDGRRLAPAASVPPEFIELTAVAVTTHTSLQRGGAMDSAERRDLVRYAAAYNPVADELEAMAHFVRHSVTAALNKVGSDALATYALAQRLSKRPETADLLPHVEDMRRALGRTRKGKSKPAAAEEETSETDSSERQGK